jgi:nucleotide-binding universal stress UspA family protein
MRILLAIDDSPKSELAIEELLRLNIPEESKLRIVTATDLPLVVQPLPMNPSMARVRADLGALRQQSSLRLQSVAEKLQEKLPENRCEIETEVLMGSPAQAVIEDAKYWGADMLVVGSHLYNSWERWLLGSPSLSIVQQTPCTIYVAREHKF